MCHLTFNYLPWSTSITQSYCFILLGVFWSGKCYGTLKKNPMNLSNWTLLQVVNHVSIVYLTKTLSVRFFEVKILNVDWIKVKKSNSSWYRVFLSSSVIVFSTYSNLVESITRITLLIKISQFLTLGPQTVDMFSESDTFVMKHWCCKDELLHASMSEEYGSW